MPRWSRIDVSELHIMSLREVSKALFFNTSSIYITLLQSELIIDADSPGQDMQEP
jgi:hypothetical protein